MLTAVQRGNKSWDVLDGIVEVGTIQHLPNGRFELRVHGVSWQEGEPSKHVGKASHTFARMTDAFVMAGYCVGRFL